MSSPDTLRRRLLQGAVGVLLLVGPTACFRPLYGPTASGAPVQEKLAEVQVEMPEGPQGQERFGHYLRSELIFNLDGSGKNDTPKRYKLLISTTESVQGTTIDIVSGRANTAVLNGAANFRLTAMDGTTVLLSGVERASATYYRDEQRFANVRAARDADIRVAKTIADNLRQRIAAFFATAS